MTIHWTSYIDADELETVRRYNEAAARLREQQEALWPLKSLVDRIRNKAIQKRRYQATTPHKEK